MNANLDELLKKKYITIVELTETTDGGQCYIAYHPEMRDQFAQGDTPDEAIQNLEEVWESVLKHLIEHNLPIPEPRPPSRALSETQSLDFENEDVRLTRDFEPAPSTSDEHGPAGFRIAELAKASSR